MDCVDKSLPISESTTNTQNRSFLIMEHGEEVAEQLNPASLDCLPDELLVQILSFLPTKQAASTSLLSKRWRTLFAFNHNLDFDNSIFLHPKKHNDTDVQRSFDDFVDRSLASQGLNIKTFSLIFKEGSRNQGDLVVVDRWRWICNALKHGVTNLHLRVDFPIPSKIFNSTTLVKLSFGKNHYIISLSSYTSLPALKVLFLDSVCFEGDTLSKLLAACPVLEDLTIQYYNYYQEISYVVSSKTIKKLSVTYNCDYYDDFSKIISFDTPNVVDFYYSDYLRCEFPKSHLDLVAKATLDLHQWRHFENGADLTDLISEIRNVKTLNLTISAVEVIPVCCKGGLPMFKNLVDLVFSSIKEGWRLLLPRLLQHSPNLKTLVLSGLDCFPCKRHRYIRIPPNNQIKMLRIMQYQGSAHELKHLRHFLMNMGCLEVVQVYVAAAIDDPKKMQLKEDLLKLLTTSSNLKIQVI